MKKKKKRRTYRCGQRTVMLAGCGMQPKPSSLRAQAQLSETVTETFELVKVEPKLFKTLEKEKKRKGGTTEVREQAYHENIIETYLLE
ncbi:hypothetical protein TNCV_2514451 [Trichonephila clavipes]|nr:hypothetical protein TNCV_2514451 [Trichonephila clavipes]